MSPYVTQPQRNRLNEYMFSAKSAGELTYVLATVCDAYLAQHDEMRYQHLCEVLGALEGLKLELFRQMGAPYEDKVRAENGDMWTRRIAAGSPAGKLADEPNPREGP